MGVRRGSEPVVARAKDPPVVAHWEKPVSGRSEWRPLLIGPEREAVGQGVDEVESAPGAQVNTATRIGGDGIDVPRPDPASFSGQSFSTREFHLGPGFDDGSRQPIELSPP